MKKKISPQDQIKLYLRAIDLPALVIEINYKGIRYTPKNYFKLKNILLADLEVIETPL